MNVDIIDRNIIGSGNSEEWIYKENILDHYRNPRNFGKPDKYTFSCSESNPLCGDKFELFFDIKDGRVVSVKFYGSGCAISTAATSMLTDKIIGMDIERVKKIGSEDVLEMVGVSLDVVRRKCGLLCLGALNKSLVAMERLK